MLSVTPFLFELSFDTDSDGGDTSNNSTPKNSTSITSSTPKNGGSSNTAFGSQNQQGPLSADDAAKIIERNSQGPEMKANVNINPSSASEMSKQSANSASNAASRYGNESTNAGQRQSSLTSQYVTKPTRVPGRINTNPTFSATGI